MTKNKTELSDIIYEVLTDLSDYADDAIQDERDDAYAAGYKQGRFDAEMDALNGEATISPERDFLEESRRNTRPSESELSPQERRDEIVEQAKEDIDVLKDQTGTVTGRAGYETSSVLCDAEFVVNSEKRTVVCLLKGQIAGSVYGRGIAKCAPDDCFNAHIGKAIALHRVLGLEVPAEYLNTPQPTEVRVGDVVDTNSSYGVMEVGDKYDLDARVIIKEVFEVLGGARIIDDSESIAP